MGDPKKPKNKYSRPSHLWQAKRIEDEKKLIESYGLKNKKEVWRSVSFLSKLKQQAKRLIASSTKQGEIEGKLLLDKLIRLNLVGKDAKIEDVLDIGVEAVFDRRLQTQVFKLGLARTPTQARQFIIHRHITIDGETVTVPSYMVKIKEEAHISFRENSKLKDEEHPERVVVKKEKSKEVKVKKGVRDRAEKQPFKKALAEKKVGEEKKKEVKKEEKTPEKESLVKVEGKKEEPKKEEKTEQKEENVEEKKEEKPKEEKK
ncbi:MAG: 30S ribosomal protein S4 [Candidatus Woesearchaeota archaeon]